MKKREVDEKGKKRVIKLFGAASFLNDLGAYMIYSIWPIFLTAVLGASLKIVGFIDGLGDAFVSLSQAGSGYLSDRTKKRKAFIWLGYLLGGLSRIGYALSRTWGMAVPFRVLDRSGKIRDAPRDAMVAEYSRKKEHGRTFGFIQMMDRAGAVAGVLLSIWLFRYLGYRNLFLLAAVPSLIAVAILFFGVKERKRGGIKLYKGISLKDIGRNLRLLIILSAVFALGTFSYSFLMIYAAEFGFAITTLPLLLLIYILAASLIAIPFGRLSDKIGRKQSLLISYLFWVLSISSFLFLGSKTGIVVAFLFYGLFMGSVDPVQKSFVSELAPKKFKASTLGGFQMVVGLCALPASLIAGFLWDAYGKFAPFYFSLTMAIIAMLMLTWVKKE